MGKNKGMNPKSSPRPSWLDQHPKELIFEHLFKDGVVLGHVWYRPIDSGFEIDYIEISESYKGQGLSINILRAFIEFCFTQKNKPEVWLEVSDQNTPAIKLYSKAGFKNVGLRKKYYQDGSDAILMSLIPEPIVEQQ